MTGVGIEAQLRAPANLVSPRARIYWTIRALPAWIATGALATVVLLGAGWPRGIDVAVVVVVAAAAVGHLVVMPQWRFRVHRWELTETAVYTQTGWFSQERRIAPIARVQTVDTERGPLEQLFGLSNVTVTTASAKGPIRIHALDRAVAEQSVAWLTERAQRSAGDAT